MQPGGFGTGQDPYGHPQYGQQPQSGDPQYGDPQYGDLTEQLMQRMMELGKENGEI